MIFCYPGHFKIKPKQENDAENNLPDFYYDIYMFTADLTDLNTDGLINASNSSLHPGYVGDGISRRIREKGGKPLQDECKRILKQERTNDALDETDVSKNLFVSPFGAPQETILYRVTLS